MRGRLAKGFALEIPAGFGSQESEVRSATAAESSYSKTGKLLKQPDLGMAGEESNVPYG